MDGTWNQLNNSYFNPVEFEGFGQQAEELKR